MELQQSKTNVDGSALQRTFHHIVPNCKGEIIQDGGEAVCNSCGASYVTTFQETESRRHNLQSIHSFHPSSLGTTNTFRTNNLRTSLSPEYGRELKLIEMVEKISNALSLPANRRMIAADLAIKVLRRQTNKKVVLLPICIYAIVQTCRSTEARRSLSQIMAAAQSVGNIEQEKAFREFNRITSRSDVGYRYSTPEDYLNSISKKLEDSIADRIYLRAVQLRARDLLGSTRIDWQGKNPIRVAAYCIYAADIELGYKIGIELLCSVAQVPEEILRSYANKIGSGNEGSRSLKEVELLLQKESRSFRTFLTA